MHAVYLTVQTKGTQDFCFDGLAADDFIVEMPSGMQEVMPGSQDWQALHRSSARFEDCFHIGKIMHWLRHMP